MFSQNSERVFDAFGNQFIAQFNNALDFTDGIDRFLLESTLTFKQLTLEASGNSTAIKLGDELLVMVFEVK